VQKRKEEERERWWSGAEIFKPEQEKNKNSNTEDESNTKIKERYSINYSKWEEWTPVDEEEKKEQEAKKNEEFEKNNPEFCQQFLSDMEVRQTSIKKKQESSEICRLKGNRFFKAKQYTNALDKYMEALKDFPYDSKTLTNIAQVLFIFYLFIDSFIEINKFY
jgi:hypothetical protein